MKTFSDTLLFQIRNNIKVQDVLKYVLKQKILAQNSTTKFKCPLCKNWDTGINKNANLARCFECQRNFNSIDLVITFHQCSFVQAVTFLQDFL